MTRINALPKIVFAALPSLALATLLLALGCDAGPSLETRTFDLSYTRPEAAAELVDAYVYHDRETAPGRLSIGETAITVRETPDNLERIARVLEEQDRPSPTATLRFQIIEADGAAESDPGIADVESELRKLFRYEGYRLAEEAMVGGREYSDISQILGGDDGYMVRAEIGRIRRPTNERPGMVQLQVQLRHRIPVLETSVTVAEGQAVVLGTARPDPDRGAIILVVRADVVG